MPNKYSGQSDRPSDYPSTLEEMNDRFIYTEQGGRPTIYDTVDRRFMRTETFKSHLSNINVITANGPRPIGAQWLKWPMRTSYRGGVVFAPGRTPAGKFNLWEGLSVEPAKGSCKLFLNHLREIICGGDEASYNYLLDHFAWGLQNLEKKQQVAIVMRGKEGAGKGTVIDWLEAIYGAQHTIRLSSPEHVAGRFSDHLARVNLLFFDEAFWAGKVSLTGRLKTIITEGRMSSEGKGKDVEMIDTFFRTFIASNEEWAVPAAIGSRRFTVFDVASTMIGNKAYFDAIAEERRNGGAAALLHMLQRRDLSNFNERLPISTAALHHQVLHGLPTQKTYLLEVLINMEFHAKPERLESKSKGMDITTKEFHSDYLQWFADNRVYGSSATSRQFGKMLADIGVLRVGKKDRAHVRRLPPLPEFRELFAAHVTKGTATWDDLVTGWDPSTDPTTSDKVIPFDKAAKDQKGKMT